MLRDLLRGVLATVCDPAGACLDTGAHLASLGLDVGDCSGSLRGRKMVDRYAIP
jgi:hypothetical protein